MKLKHPDFNGVLTFKTNGELKSDTKSTDSLSIAGSEHSEQ